MSSVKGGYKIIDFGGISLSSTPVEISGITKQISKSVFRKALLLSGVKIGDYDMDEAFSSIVVDEDDNVNLYAYGGKFTITDEDMVSFEPVEAYELPKATSDTLGGVKVGGGLLVDSSGILSVDNLYVVEIKSATSATTVQGNSTGTINIDVAKDGYTPLLATLCSTDSTYLFAYDISFSANNTITVSLRNVSETDRSGRSSVYVLYKKN